MRVWFDFNPPPALEAYLFPGVIQVNKKDKAAVQALLQSKSAEADEDLSLQPQAKVRNEFCSHFLLSKFANVFTEKTPKTE